MKKASIVFLFSVLSMFSYSQYSYYKNVIITKSDSSTISGYVEKVSESSLNSGLKFKKSLDDKDIQKLPISEIDEVIFLEDSSIYKKVNYIHYIGINDSMKIVEYRLAKKMLAGYAELYKLQLPPNELNIIVEQTNTYVYIVKIDTNYYLLEQKEILNGTNYNLNKKYIGALTYILRDHEDLKRKVNNLQFNDKQIIPLINKLNLKHSEIPSKILITKEKIKISHGPTVGYTMLNNFENQEYNYYKRFEGSGFDIGYSIGFISPEITEKISTDIGFSLEQIYFKDVNNNRYSASLLKFPINATYCFINKKISPFLGIGFVPYLYLSEISSDITLRDIFLKLSLGLNIYKKYIISFAIENTDLKLNSPRFLFLNIGYRFGTGNSNIKK